MDASLTDQQPVLTQEADVQANKDIAALSYVWVLSVFIYVLKAKHSPFIKYHARQAMVLFVLSLVFWFIPLLGTLLELVVLAGMVVGFLAAAQGEWKDVPFVGPFSRGEKSLRQTWKQIIDTIAGFARELRPAKPGQTPNPEPGGTRAPQPSATPPPSSDSPHPTHVL